MAQAVAAEVESPGVSVAWSLWLATSVVCAGAAWSQEPQTDPDCHLCEVGASEGRGAGAAQRLLWLRDPTRRQDAFPRGHSEF